MYPTESRERQGALSGSSGSRRARVALLARAVRLGQVPPHAPVSLGRPVPRTTPLRRRAGRKDRGPRQGVETPPAALRELQVLPAAALRSLSSRHVRMAPAFG